MIKGCLLGENPHYSYSKKIHEALGTSYDLVALRKDQIKSFLATCDYDFINVTVPYKEEVLKYLDILTDEVKNIQACNLIKRENGKLVGYNTDYLGFIKALDFHHVDYKNKNVLILGTGGAAKAIYYAFNNSGSLSEVASRGKNEYQSYDYVNKNLDKYDIIINATPLGLYPNFLEKPLIDISKVKGKVVFDIIYNPRRTRLLINAKKDNIIINGISMLVYQALLAYPNYSNLNASALINLLNKESNIVIIGMPYSGKSYLGKVLQEKYPERDLYDIDEIVEKRYGKISDIFKKYGEEKFRDYEEEVIKEVAIKDNAIIIPGAGFIKRENNILMLKANGVLYYLNKSLDEIKENYLLTKDDSRPLVLDIKDLDKLYQERDFIYKEIMDEEVIGEFDDYYSN